MNTKKEIENIARTITIQSLKDVPDIKKKVRISFPTYNKSGDAPGWKREEDIIFLAVRSQENQMNRLRDVSRTFIDSETTKKSIRYTRVLLFSWIFYGENAFDYAEQLRVMLLDQTIRNILAPHGLFIVPDFAAPIRSPELFQGAYWERSDFSIEVYEAVHYESTTNLLDQDSIQEGIQVITKNRKVKLHGNTNT